ATNRKQLHVGRRGGVVRTTTATSRTRVDPHRHVVKTFSRATSSGRRPLSQYDAWREVHELAERARQECPSPYAWLIRTPPRPPQRLPRLTVSRSVRAHDGRVPRPNLLESSLASFLPPASSP